MRKGVAKIKTLLKWAGGKTRELPYIRRNMPISFDRYVEPFVGGGAVFFDMGNVPSYINDKSRDLMQFYECVKAKDTEFVVFINRLYQEFSSLGDYIDSHSEEMERLYRGERDVRDLASAFPIAMLDHAFFVKELSINVKRKIKRIEELKARGGDFTFNPVDIVETAIKSAYYMYVRHLYNHVPLSKGRRSAVYFFIREFGYGSMFRFNKQGEYNEPYGGLSYNRKDFQAKIDHLFSDMVQEKLKNTCLYCGDFEEFMDGLNLTENDFIFIDPPYDTAFSTYDKNVFGETEQERLADYLGKTPAKFMAVMKCTELILKLYKNFNIIHYDNQYQVNMKNRNDKKAQHIIVKNYG